MKKLRKEYIVVTRTFADDDKPSYSITKRINFSVMPYHDTFGRYGEVDYTCDYTIEENDFCFDEFKSSVKNELRLGVERTCDGLSFTDPDTGEEVAITPAFELYIKMWRGILQVVFFSSLTDQPTTGEGDTRQRTTYLRPQGISPIRGLYM